MNKILRISIVVVICLIVILAVALIIGQCSAPAEEETTTTTPTTTTTTTTTTEKPTTPPAPECTEHVDNNNDYICDVCEKELEKPTVDAGLTVTNDKVYVLSSKLNLRKTPDETGVATVSVNMDTELERIGYYATGDNEGLSKITYEGQIYYIATDYVTTQKPMTDADFTTVEETVYVVEGRSPYVFSKPSHIEKHQYSEKIGTLVSGQAVTRLGVATKVYVDDEGITYTFAKVRYEFNGETFVGYVNNTLLTTEAPANPDNGVVFEADTSVLKVIAETSINLRTSAEYPAENVGGHAANGQLLQATHKGTESNGRVWYKVVVNEVTYYVIFLADTLEVQTPAAQ